MAVLGGSFQTGWCIGVFNTPVEVIKGFYKEVYMERGQTLSKTELNTLWSITNGLLPFGGVFGGLSSGFFADNFGRKTSIILINNIVIITACLNIISKYVSSIETLLAGRFLSGIYSGLFCGVVPLYLSEIAPVNLRGLAGTLNQLFLVVGILMSNIAGLKQIFGTEYLWPVLGGIYF